MSRSFLEMVAERYGNPNAVFADGHIKVGQRIRVILGSRPHPDAEYTEKVVDARYAGKGRVKYSLGGRMWIQKVGKEQILVEW